jgi:O-antigen ligase
LFFLPLLISYIISTNVIENTDKADVSSRIASISSTTDESINSRLRYWSHATDFIYKNPFLGGGIGNWRIYSIKYDSEYIKSYIVPYSAHNDLLEFTAETGIIGGLIFLSFFVILFLLIMKTSGIFSEKFDFKIGFILISSFLIYFLDLNLNFPTSRPLNLFLLLMLISLTTILLNKMNDKI